MTDDRRVDTCFQALLKMEKAHIRPPRAGTTIEAFRNALNAPLVSLDGPGVPEVLDVFTNRTEPCPPIRLYRSRTELMLTPAIIFIHGGGFVAGSIGTHDGLCRALCVASGLNVLSIDYRLAPEHPYPAAIEDCVAALDWVADNFADLRIDPSRISICGDSAGGYLAVQVALKAVDGRLRVRPSHVGLLYPVVDPACNTQSMLSLADGHILTRSAMQWFWKSFSGERGASVEGLSLLSCGLSNLPPVTIVTAEFDPLRDEGASLASAIRASGTPVSYRCWEGMIHGFASLPHMTAQAPLAIEHLSAEVKANVASACAFTGACAVPADGFPSRRSGGIAATT